MRLQFYPQFDKIGIRMFANACRNQEGQTQMKYCSQCAREYPDSALFCTQCGIRLAERPAPAAEAAPAEDSAPVAETVPAEDSPAEAAADTIMPDDFAEPTIVDASPAAIEINIAVPETPAAPTPAAVAVAKEPAPSPVVPPQETFTPVPPPVVPPQEAPEPQEENRRDGNNIGFFRKAGAFFLCIPLFLFLLIPTMIYQVRDASTEAWISNYLEKVSTSDWIGFEGIGDAIEDWLQGLAPELKNLEYDPSNEVSEIDRLIDSADIKGFAAGRLASYLADLYSGASGTAFEADDISGLMEENSELINDQLTEMVEELFGSRSGVDIKLTRGNRNSLAKQLIGLMEDTGVYDYLDTDTVKEETPVVYYGLRYGLSYIAGGVFLVLAILIFICLVKTLKSGLRATNRAGIVLIILGGALTLLALFPKLFGDLWLQLFDELHILALFAEEFFYTHILVDLGILGVGVLLTVATGVALSIRKKRAVQ